MFATQRTFDSQPDRGCATVRTPRSLPAALGVTYRALHRWFAQSQLGPVDNYVIR
jgi:hypothetical protein